MNIFNYSIFISFPICTPNLKETFLATFCHEASFGPGAPNPTCISLAFAHNNPYRFVCYVNLGRSDL